MYTASSNTIQGTSNKSVGYYRQSSKKYLYLEPPIPGRKTVRTRVTRIAPPREPSPPPVFYHQPPPMYIEAPPLVVEAPPPVFEPPPLIVDAEPPEPVLVPPAPPSVVSDSTIDVIAVDVEPAEKRHTREKIYIERERVVPVHVPVPMPMSVKMHQRRTPPPEYDSYRYVDAPRPYAPPREEEWETHDRVVIREREREMDREMDSERGREREYTDRRSNDYYRW